MNTCHAGSRHEARSRRAFTLIELLVVVAIIAILVSILMPAVSKARLLAKQVACASQMRSIALAATIYRADYNDKIPIHAGTQVRSADGVLIPNWRFLLARDGGAGGKVFDCPGTKFLLMKPGVATDIRNIIDTADVTKHPLSSANAGSIGVRGLLPAMGYKPGFPVGQRENSEGAFDNSTSSPGDIAWTLNIGWKNPQKAMYVSDVYMVQGFRAIPITYPSTEVHDGSDSIHAPNAGYYLNTTGTSDCRRFADRHNGSNVLFLNGSVLRYKTQDLDAMNSTVASVYQQYFWYNP